MNRSQVNIPKSSLGSILDFLPYPFLLAQTENGTVFNSYVNKRFIEEIGYSLKEIPTIDHWFNKAYPDLEYRQHIYNVWMSMIADANTSGKDYVIAKARIFTKSNGYKWFEVKSSLFGEGLQFVSFVNIDDVVAKEEELKKANENKNKMLSILSHDLRSAMINLYSLTNLATNKVLSLDEFLSLAPQVKERSAQALELLDTTVHWTKTNFETINLIKQPISIKAIIVQVLEADSTYRDKNIKLVVDIDSELQPLIDPGIITIIIRNLISNAVKFSPEGGTVEVHAFMTSTNFQLTVKDSGSGMDAQLVEAILSDQYSPSTGTMREKGSGVGLTLCRDLLKKIDGTLSIASTPGKGTEMRIVVNQ